MESFADFEQINAAGTYVKKVPLYQFYGGSGRQWFKSTASSFIPNAATLIYVKAGEQTGNGVVVGKVVVTYYLKMMAPRITNLNPPGVEDEVD